MDQVGVYQDCKDDEFENQIEELDYIGISPIYQSGKSASQYIKPHVFPPKSKTQKLSSLESEHLRGNYSSNKRF